MKDIMVLLTGLNKDEMKKKLGEEKVHQFRDLGILDPNL